MITPFRQIRNACQFVKWWFMRANHKLPPCDWWDFKYNLADFIVQGLEGLLYHSPTDWDSDYHKQEKKDLETVLKWAKTFPYMENAIVVPDDEYKEMSEKMGDGWTVLTEDMCKDWEKQQAEAFRLLAKNIHTLWG